MFTYQPVFVPSFEDALIGVLFNHNVQAVVIRFDFRLHSKNRLPVLTRYLEQAECRDFDDIESQDYGTMLADVIGRIRPELDLYLVTSQSVEEVAGRNRRFLPAGLLQPGRLHRTSPQYPARRGCPLSVALLHRPQGIFQATHRRVPRTAHIVRKIHHQIQLDPRHGRLLRDEHLSCRNLGHFRRSGLTSRTARTHQEST